MAVRRELSLVAVASIDGDQLKILQKWARLRDKFDVPAAWTRQHRVTGIPRYQARAHELIALERLLAA